MYIFQSIFDVVGDGLCSFHVSSSVHQFKACFICPLMIGLEKAF